MNLHVLISPNMFKSHSNTIQVDGSMKTNDRCKLNLNATVLQYLL